LQAKAGVTAAEAYAIASMGVDTATEACFDVSWRSLYLGLGIHSVQSAPVFSFNGRPLATFVVALRQPGASFDTEMTSFGVYAMRTMLQKPPCYSGPR
jgi:hypothetical protein